MPTIGDRRREMQRTIDTLRAKLDSASEHAFREEEACRVALRDMEQACDQRDSIAFALAAEQAENVRLRRFCDRCWDIARDGCDMDGAEIQESLVACGFLVGTKRTEACGENCRCVEYYGADEPWTCYEPATPAPVDALREVCEKAVWATKARCEDYHARYKMQVLPFNGADAEHVVSSILGPRETVERVAHAGSTHSKTLPEASHE